MTIGPVLDILEEKMMRFRERESSLRTVQGSSLSNDQPDPILDMGESIELNRLHFLQWDKRWAADGYGKVSSCLTVVYRELVHGAQWRVTEFISPVEVISHAGRMMWVLGGLRGLLWIDCPACMGLVSRTWPMTKLPVNQALE